MNDTKDKNNNDRERLRVCFKNIDDPDSYKTLRYQVYTQNGYLLEPVEQIDDFNVDFDIYYLYTGKYMVGVKNVDRSGRHYCALLWMKVSHSEVIDEGRYETIARLPISLLPRCLSPPCFICWNEEEDHIYFNSDVEKEVERVREVA